MHISSALNKIVLYVKESFYEFKRVVWPTRKQAISHSIVVVIMSIAVAAFLASLDIIFSSAIQRLLL